MWQQTTRFFLRFKSTYETMTVEGENHQMRLDRYLKSKISSLSSVAIFKLLRTKKIILESSGAKIPKVEGGTRVSQGDVVKIDEISLKKVSEEVEKSKFVTKSVEISKKSSEKWTSMISNRMIFQDKDILVINKPNGIACQGGTNLKVHLDEIIKSFKFESKEDPRLVHRLDLETSGVLIFARNRLAANRLSKIFHDRYLIAKEYWALLKTTPSIRIGKITMPIIHEQRYLSDEQFEVIDSSGNEVLDTKSSKRALTEFEVVSTLGRNQPCLAKLYPVSGRKHQIRIHCSKGLNAPVFGDSLYGGKSDYFNESNIPKNEMFLHLRKIVIKNWYKSQDNNKGNNSGDVELIAPAPDHFIKAFKLFGLSEKLMANKSRFN